MHNTWIFQANPKRFDIDGYFATKPPRPLWSVTRLGDRMRIGDQVFIWRAKGHDDVEKSGVIAHAEIIETPRRQSDDPDALPFWNTATSGEDHSLLPQLRVRLRSLRFSSSKSMLRREWLKQDPILSHLEILRIHVGTNYLLSPKHGVRLAGLWSRVGQDWSYAESILGLWNYMKLQGQPVSKLPDSLIARASLLTNRVVSGVYDKVMNFRSLDARDAREGFGGASTIDADVWREFYDESSSELREQELNSEYERFWGAISGLRPFQLRAQENVDLTGAANDFSDQDLSLLLERYHKTGDSAARRPQTRVSSSIDFIRDPLVAGIALKRAVRRCEVPDCSHELFTGRTGHPYIEVHHIDPLANGGADSIENVACLCPAHHRELHHGKNAASLTRTLKNLRSVRNDPARLSAV